MHIEAYERLKLDITKFDVEDVITTSGEATENENEMFGPIAGGGPAGGQ